MIRICLLIAGFMLLITQQYIYSFDINLQFVFFIVGILFLGVPHGAADLLVANQNAESSQQTFSKFRFLGIYLGRLFLFAAVLWFFPVFGNILFIFFAAYHFGETDLYQFKTDTFFGKIFIISYGLLILSVILLHHFEDVMPIYLQFESGKKNAALIHWIDLHRYTLLSISGIAFFSTTFIYFLKNRHSTTNANGHFLIRFALILFILFSLPMLLGFTFYFVIWHSFLSLNNIVNYLRDKNRFSKKIIIQQIVFYSSLAILGIAVVGFAGFMFTSNTATMGYLFLGLAVLTAPHMQIMHEMYSHFRLGLKSE
jgi:Brp/Blh family beta-carotene 15,15'-monooxygenase